MSGIGEEMYWSRRLTRRERIRQVPEHATRESIEWIRDALQDHFPDNEIVVCGGGLRVAAVLRNEPQA